MASTLLSRWFLCRHRLYRKRTRYPKSGRLVPTTLWYWFRTLSMTDERLYDYSKGLNAPYWIQEIKTKKGTRLWYFATPMQLSFFIVFTFVFVAMLLFGGFILVPLAKFTHSISLLLYWYLPYKLAKFYTEYEPHGKKMHVFIGDYLIYF